MSNTSVLSNSSHCYSGLALVLASGFAIASCGGAAKFDGTAYFTCQKLDGAGAVSCTVVIPDGNVQTSVMPILTGAPAGSGVPSNSVQPTVSQAPVVTPSGSVQPTVSQAPVVTPSGSVQPTVSQAPVVTPSGSVQPTVSQAPVVTPSGSVQPTVSQAPVVTPSGSVQPTVSQAPVVTPSGSVQPTVSQAPVVTPSGSVQPTVSQAPVDTAMPPWVTDLPTNEIPLSASMPTVITSAQSDKAVSLRTIGNVGSADTAASRGFEVQVADGVPADKVLVKINHDVFTSGDEALEVNCKPDGHSKVRVAEGREISAKGNVHTIALNGCKSGSVDVFGVVASDGGSGVMASDGRVDVTNYGLMKTLNDRGSVVRLGHDGSSFRAMAGSRTRITLGGGLDRRAAIYVPLGEVRFDGGRDGRDASILDIGFSERGKELRSSASLDGMLPKASIELPNGLRPNGVPPSGLSKQWTHYLDSFSTAVPLVVAKSIKWHGTLKGLPTTFARRPSVVVGPMVETRLVGDKQLVLRYLSRRFVCSTKPCTEKVYGEADNVSDGVNLNSYFGEGTLPPTGAMVSDSTNSHAVFTVATDGISPIRIGGFGEPTKSRGVSLVVADESNPYISSEKMVFGRNFGPNNTISINNFADMNLAVAEGEAPTHTSNMAFGMGALFYREGDRPDKLEIRMANSGAISVSGRDVAGGMVAVGDRGTDFSLLNVGSIDVSGSIAAGITGDVKSDRRLAIVNAGQVKSVGDTMVASGATSSTVSLVNLKELETRGVGSSSMYGVFNSVSDGSGGGALNLLNAGKIINEAADSGYGMKAEAQGELGTVLNSGTIVMGRAFSAGIFGLISSGGRLTMVNTGTIDGTKKTNSDVSTAMLGRSDERGTISIENSGDILIAGKTRAIFAAFQGDANIVNSGSIRASGIGSMGIQARFAGSAGSLILENSRDLNLESGIGIQVDNDDFANEVTGSGQITNSGLISILGRDSLGIRSELNLSGTRSIRNSGRISTLGNYSDAVSARWNLEGEFSVLNSGTIETFGNRSDGIRARLLLRKADLAGAGTFTNSKDGRIFTSGVNSSGLKLSVENSREIDGLSSLDQIRSNVTLTVFNSGEIVASGESSKAVSIRDVKTLGDNKISLINDGRIVSSGRNGVAIRMYGDKANERELENRKNGLIWSHRSYALYFEDDVTTTSVVNQGTIRGLIDLKSSIGSSRYEAQSGSVTEVVLPEDSGMAPITLAGGSVDIQAGSKMRVRIPDQVWTRGTAKLIEVGGAGRIRMNGSLSGARVGHERDDKTSADWVWADVDWDQVAGLVKLTGGLSSDRTVYRINWDIDQDSVTRWQNTVAAGARHLVSPVRDSLKAVRSGALTGRAFGVLQAMGLNEQFSKTYRQILPASQPLHLLHSAPSLFRMMDGGLSHRHGITGEEVTASFESTELEGLQGWHVSMRTSDGGSAKVMGLDTQAGRNFRFGTMLSSAGSSRTGSGDLRQTSFSSELASVSAYGLYRNGKVFGDVRLGVGRGWSRTHAAIEVLNTDTTSQGTAWGMSSRALVGLDLGIVRPYASLSLTQMSQDPFDLVGEDVRITAGGSSRLDTSVRLGVSIEQEVSLGEARRLTLGMNGSWTKALNPKGGSLRYGYGRSGDPLTYQMEIDGDDEHQFTLSPSAQLDLGEHMEMKGSLHARYSPSDGAQVEASTSFSWQF